MRQTAGSRNQRDERCCPPTAISCENAGGCRPLGGCDRSALAKCGRRDAADWASRSSAVDPRDRSASATEPHSGGSRRLLRSPLRPLPARRHSHRALGARSASAAVKPPIPPPTIATRTEQGISFRPFPWPQSRFAVIRGRSWPIRHKGMGYPGDPIAGARSDANRMLRQGEPESRMGHADNGCLLPGCVDRLIRASKSKPWLLACL